MGIIIKNQIQYTGGGSGGGGTPVEIIDNVNMEELEEAGTYDSGKIYLVYDSDSEALISVFQDGWYHGIARSGGSTNYHMSWTEWTETVGTSDPDEWDVSNVALGWYFIYNWDGYYDALIYIVHVIDDEGSHVIERPVIENRTENDASRTNIMTQAQYDALIGEHEIPLGFIYCTDSKNLYHGDQVIVENTPPTP